MMIEAVRVIDAAVRDATIGLAVQLAAVPREGGDPVPATPTIYNEAQHGEASRDAFPDGAGPYLLITTASVEDANALVRPVQDFRVGLAMRYAIRHKDTATALRSGSYTFRALLRTLGKLFSTTVGTTLRTRNQVGLYHLNNFGGGILSAPLADTPLSWALTCTATMRDGWANT